MIFLQKPLACAKKIIASFSNYSKMWIFLSILKQFIKHVNNKKKPCCTKFSCLVWSGSLLGFDTARYGDFDSD